MNTDTFLPYGKQSITQEDVDVVTAALHSDWITRGPKVEEFEQAVAAYCGAEYAVAFTSGTAALMGACHAAGVGPNDRVITTPNTFVATVGAAARLGATPVFVDIDRSTGNINLDHLKHTVEVPSTRGQQVIIPVHFAGIAVDMARLDHSLVNPDSIVIEDAAHAIGSSYPDGKKVGCCAYSAMTTFSFHPVKTITSGEGGMVTTNDPELYHRLKRFRNNGIERLPDHPNPWHYDVTEITGNYNFTDMQAALGLSQLSRLDAFASKRRELILAYREAFRDVPHVKLFSADHDSATCYHLMVVQIDFEALEIPRSELMKALKEKGIGTQVHYIPVYRHSFFTKKSGDISQYFPEMETYFSQVLSLPLFPGMTAEDVNRVVDAIKHHC